MVYSPKVAGEVYLCCGAIYSVHICALLFLLTFLSGSPRLSRWGSAFFVWKTTPSTGPWEHFLVKNLCVAPTRRIFLHAEFHSRKWHAGRFPMHHVVSESPFWIPRRKEMSHPSVSPLSTPVRWKVSKPEAITFCIYHFLICFVNKNNVLTMKICRLKKKRRKKIKPHSYLMLLTSVVTLLIIFVDSWYHTPYST